MDGDQTRSWESALLAMLRSRGVVPDKSSLGGRFDGYAESWPRSSLEVTSLRELLDLVTAEEDDPATS